MHQPTGARSRPQAGKFAATEERGFDRGLESLGGRAEWGILGQGEGGLVGLVGGLSWRGG